MRLKYLGKCYCLKVFNVLDTHPGGSDQISNTNVQLEEVSFSFVRPVKNEVIMRAEMDWSIFSTCVITNFSKSFNLFFLYKYFIKRLINNCKSLKDGRSFFSYMIQIAQLLPYPSSEVYSQNTYG